MSFLIGKKQKIEQLFADDGTAYAATPVLVDSMKVIQVKTKDKDGYDAVQFGVGLKSSKSVSKSVKGHLKKHLGDDSIPAFIREWRVGESASPLKSGDLIDVSVLKEGDIVAVRSVSKGKGFQGVVKRHGFKGGPRTHGQKHSEREAGSIGGGGRAGGRVVKGMRMAGRMGGDNVYVKNLKVLKVLPQQNLILISGAVPGVPGALVEITG